MIINIKDKIKLCITINAILLIIIILCVIFFRDDQQAKYIKFGPSDSLSLLGVKINTWNKYIFVCGLMALIKVLEVIINEIGNPILNFNIYNPDKKVIIEFTKNELHIMASIMAMISSIRNVFMVIVSITQIDLALIMAVVSEIVSIFTVRLLLNEKVFK